MRIINQDEEVLICKKTIDTFGNSIQMVVAMEELSELIKALSNAILECKNNIEEEVADVEIITTQLRLMFGSCKVDDALQDYKVFSKHGVCEKSIRACSELIQSLSKVIRKGECKYLYKHIAGVIVACRCLREKFNNKEIDGIKQFKLKRLEGVVYSGKSRKKETTKNI